MPTCEFGDVDTVVRPHKAGIGKHGNTVAAEIRALRALVDRKDGMMAALVLEAAYQRGVKGVLAGGLKGRCWKYSQRIQSDVSTPALTGTTANMSTVRTAETTVRNIPEG